MSVYDDVQALQAMFEYCYDAETGEVERINSTILFALHNTGKDKITAGTFTVSTRKSSQLIVNEDEFNDDRFIEKVVTQKIDKMAVKQAIKQGEIIDGCQIKEVENLQVK